MMILENVAVFFSESTTKHVVFKILMFPSGFDPTVAAGKTEAGEL
jgi:hypothetical protein